MTLVRLYIGWKWLSAGWGKLTGANPFDASGFLKGAVAKPILETGSNHPLYPG
ncbi:hypothetical protein [Paenibacillus tyrfis]|uniref:hypothetical protein n=1 Tax=Paenibacillus tyrfis TaxID=1501230 RepID=UPI0015C5B12F|nr:hypothetical protein [Paenibacillus tyrfis]